MNHMPFEKQLFDDQPMNEQQDSMLKAHLSECGQCRKLQSQWQFVEQQLSSAPMASPVPGFRNRWQAGLSRRRSIQQRRQVFRFLITLLTADAVSLIILGITSIISGSAAQWVLSTAKTVSTAFLIWGKLLEVASAIIELLPPAAPAFLAILFAGGLFLATALWVVSLWRISFQGVKVK